MKRENDQLYTISDADFEILDGEYEVIDGTKHTTKKTQTGLLLPALILAALGLTALIFPGVFGTGLAFLITAGLFLFGLSQTVMFTQTPREERSGWMLANGILLLLFSGVTILSAFWSPIGVLQMISAVSFLLGLLTATTGLTQLGTGLTAKRGAPGRGWVLFGGGLNLLISVFLCLNPIVSWFALTTVWGMYLMASAMALLLMVWSPAHNQAG